MKQRVRDRDNETKSERQRQRVRDRDKETKIERQR